MLAVPSLTVQGPGCVPGGVVCQARWPCGAHGGTRIPVPDPHGGLSQRCDRIWPSCMANAAPQARHAGRSPPALAARRASGTPGAGETWTLLIMTPCWVWVNKCFLLSEIPGKKVHLEYSCGVPENENIHHSWLCIWGRWGWIHCLTLVQGILNKNQEKMVMKSYTYIFFGPEEEQACD